MMRLRVRTLGSAQHPSEVLVAARTAEGREEQVVVDKGSVRGETLEIGWPIDERDDRMLVELPRETVRGAWRLWVPRSSIVRDEERAA